jgi:hypothetical protein
MRRLTYLLLGLVIPFSTFAQSVAEVPFTETDSTATEPVVFTTSSASAYIIDLLERDHLWRQDGDTIKRSLARLIDQFREPFDSVESRLSSFNYDSVKLEEVDIIRNDTLPLRWLNDSTFMIDTAGLKKEPLIIQKTVMKEVIYRSALDSAADVTNTETLTDFLKRVPDIMVWARDTVVLARDTITTVCIDSALLESMNIQLYQIAFNRIVPPLLPTGGDKSFRFMADSANIIVSDRARAMVASEESPFHIVSSERMLDSLRYAVETLLSHTAERDSILLFINDILGQKTPLWLTQGNNDLYRFWVKNYENDSITIWMGNPSKRDIMLILEEDLDVVRLEKEEVDHVPIISVEPEMSLAEVKPLAEIPVYWDYNFSSSFTLNQTYFSNWSKGGENSFSGLLDVNVGAIYTNTEAKTQWTNAARWNFGTLITEQNGLRTNTDLLEFNSKYNKVIREKLDFSAVFYMKNQIARGYNYPNDSVVVSKFLNPGTFTIGLGVEYKPFKNTSLNFSPLSYRNTFVLDTADIDQTIHGIKADKRARQEMGGQLVIMNKTSILKDLKITNSVRLFSSYLNKPQNIDVDWEINLEQKINWYSSVTLNLHMIYDDDVRFPDLDENGQPILLPDGSVYKVPKLQFKQYLGLSFLFRF